MRVALIGSCVTRDIWRVMNLDASALHFVARTSFVSMMSPPPAGASCFRDHGSSAFERRCLESDVSKTSFGEILRFGPDLLLLDFMDERFDLLQIDRAFVLHTAELQYAGGLDLDWARAAAIHDRSLPKTTWLWIKSVQLFLGAVARAPALAGIPIVLHRAPWAARRVPGSRFSEHSTATPDIYQIAPGKLVSLHQYDMLTRCYYEVFQALHPRTIAVEAPASLHLGAGDHVWGESPFHYIDEYYECVADKLRLLGAV